MALIGPGLFARSSLMPLLATLDVELSAVSGRSGARALSVAKRFDVGRVAHNTGEIFSDNSIDVVIIATRHDSHAQLVADGLEAGKAVFVEKPLALTGEELDRLARALPSDGRLVVDFNRRLAPATQTLAARLQERADPIHVNCRVNAGAVHPDHWLRDRSEGGGRLIGEGCHFIDLCSALVGSAPSAFAVAGMGRGPATLQGDSFVLSLRYPDGSLASISYIATGNPRMPKERIEVIGAGRSLVIDDFRRVHLYGRGPTLPRPTSRQDKGHAAIIKAALAFFRGASGPPVPYDSMFSTSRLAIDAQERLERGHDGFTAVADSA